MKATLALLTMCLCYCWAGAQRRIDTSKYVWVPGSNTYILKTDSSRFMRHDGEKLFDVRRATLEQLSRLAERERKSVLQQDRFWGLYAGPSTFPRHSLALRFEQNTGAKIYEGNSWKWGTLSKRTILIQGKSDVEIIDGLIKPADAKNYRYRIIQNDSKELVGWTTPSVFKRTANGLATYCFLGNIAYQANQIILVEIYHVKNYRDRDAIIIDWRPTRPLNFWTTIDFRKKNWGNTIFSSSLGNDKKSTTVNFLATDTLRKVIFRLGDSLVRLGFHSHNEPTPYNYQINFKRNINGKEEQLELGDLNGKFYLYKAYWDRPGKYEITFTPKLSTIGGGKTVYHQEKSVTYRFIVLEELDAKKLFSSKELALILLVVVAVMGAIVGALVAYTKKKNSQKLAVSDQEKEIAKSQLNSIRAQLNPHFMFNALAGIQNLMNLNKVDDANDYLNNFARLTRNVLDQKDLISLADEKALLNDYLQMEQLRFGFNYQLRINDIPNADNIEIPSMLLQPFVENAVKHGIAEMGNDGTIEVVFAKNGDNLILMVIDNGSGFDPKLGATGLGVQLSKSRIALLNKIYPITPFKLDIVSNKNGTKVSITLTQWL